MGLAQSLTAVALGVRSTIGYCTLRHPRKAGGSGCLRAAPFGVVALAVFRVLSAFQTPIGSRALSSIAASRSVGL